MSCNTHSYKAFLLFSPKNGWKFVHVIHNILQSVVILLIQFMYKMNLSLYSLWNFCHMNLMINAYACIAFGYLLTAWCAHHLACCTVMLMHSMMPFNLKWCARFALRITGNLFAWRPLRNVSQRGATIAIAHWAAHCNTQCATLNSVPHLIVHPIHRRHGKKGWVLFENGPAPWRTLLQASSSWQLGADFKTGHFNGNIYFLKNLRLYHVYKSCLDNK